MLADFNTHICEFGSGGKG